MAEAAGVFYGVETVLEGAVALAKGIYDPTLPLKAMIREISDVKLEVQHGTLDVVKGRGYVFGGVDGDGKLSESVMHVIHLPMTDFESTDYERISVSASSPPPRCGHASAVIGDQIYIFGGSSSPDPSSPKALEEAGRVWVFDTVDRTWSSLTPENETLPTGQVFVAAVGTDLPRPASEDKRENDPNPKFSTAKKDLLPKDDLDPADNVPEPAAPSTYGTLVVYGGVNPQDGKPTNDLWAFDISSRTWSQLSSPPLVSEASARPNLALVNNRLYTYAEGKTYYLDLDMRSAAFSTPGNIDLGLSPLGPWTTIAPASTASSGSGGTSGPGHRDDASLIPVTTGQGRNYLLLVGGSEEGDIWVLQLKPDGMTAASFKDAARLAVKRGTKEETWAEVKYFDTEGKMIQEGQAGRGVGGRVGSAVSKMGEMDGGAFVVWGGRDGGKTGDGLIVTVDI